MKELHRDFVLAWETSTSVTEVAVKLAAAGYFEFTPELVVRYARALRKTEVRLKRITRGLAPTLYSDESVPVAEPRAYEKWPAATFSDFELSVLLDER